DQVLLSGLFLPGGVQQLRDRFPLVEARENQSLDEDLLAIGVLLLFPDEVNEPAHDVEPCISLHCPLPPVTSAVTRRVGWIASATVAAEVEGQEECVLATQFRGHPH